jgi:amino acid transporter
MTVRDATPHLPAAEDQEDKHRLTALEGLAALSLDALSSVAYGPEAIVIVLAAAGTVGLGYTVPVTIAIVVLLVVLVISYRQVIEAFPNGGGAYAVAKRHLGRYASLTAGASLTVDYVLNAAVGVSAGVEAFTSAFPSLYPDRVWICLGVLAIITAANMWGVAESARLFIVPTLIFIASIAIVIAGGLIRTHPAVPPSGHLPAVAESVGILLLLKAFASGCSALTGVEAIANAVPQLTAAAVGHNILFYAIQLITTVLLALAANTSFGGLPVLASLLARDNFLPHMFALKAERSVFRYGVGVLAVFAAVLLVVSKGDTQKLIPVFAIGVFVGFTLSQAGMVKHWHEQHTDGWVGRAFINGLGAVLTTVALAIELVSKFTEGAWLVVIVIPLVVLLFRRIHRAYDEIGVLLELGKIPDPPERTPGLAVVPVRGMSRLTREAVSAALSLADDAVAVTICYDDPDEEQTTERFRAQWEEWDPGVPLVTLRTAHRSLGPPVVDYLRAREQEDPHRRIVVVIPEVQPEHWWRWFLNNQRGFVLSQAITMGTDNVVVCRLRFQLRHLAPDEDPGDVPGSPSASTPGPT